MTPLRELRHARGLTQKELALRSGMSAATLSQVELGRQNLNQIHIMKLARIFGPATMINFVMYEQRRQRGEKKDGHSKTD